MIRFVSVLAAVLVGSAAWAQTGSPSEHLKHEKKPAPAAQKADDPDDVTKVPRKVQNWFSGAVGDILNGEPLGAAPGKR